jgi:predicted nucleic acid-binding Zn ribbon protein
VGSGGGGGGTLSGFYRLTPRHSGKALVVQSASTSNSAAVIQYTYGGSATNDEWELQSIGSDYYRIINRNSGKDMVVQSASTSDAANIIQYTYGGSTTNDEWQLVDNGNGYYRIVNRNSGKVVEVAGSSTADGAAAQQRTWNGGTNQEFQLESIAAAVQANAAKTTTAAIVNRLEPATLRFQNPASGSVVIDLNLPEEGHTNLTVFDQVGRAVAVLVNSHLSKGRHRVTLDKQAITAGTYIIRLVQNNGQVSKQLIRQ